MDNKERYSKTVTEQNILSNKNAHLRDRIEKGWERRREHLQNWHPVDINEVIEKFAPDGEPVAKGIKVNWHSPTTGFTVVADVCGYLRIQDMNPGPFKKTYLDLNGKHVEGYPKLPDESDEEYFDRKQRCSHFRILKKRS